MHEFNRFIQSQCDLRGWRPSELATRSGLSRQHVSKLLNDKRSHLGQMPDDKTIEGLARAFEGVSEQTVRDAAARALGAVDDVERQTELDLRRVSIDALLTEIKRRVLANVTEKQEPRTEEGSTEHGSAGRTARRPGAPMKLVKSTDGIDEYQGLEVDRADWGDNSVPLPSLDEADAADADFDDDE